MAVAQRRKKHNARPIEGRGSYWRFLPAFYEEADQSEDENERGVLNGLLRIAETILTPLERTIDQIHYYFDPRLAPMAMLPWLAFWVDQARRGIYGRTSAGALNLLVVSPISTASRRCAPSAGATSA